VGWFVVDYCDFLVVMVILPIVVLLESFSDLFSFFFPHFISWLSSSLPTPPSSCLLLYIPLTHRLYSSLSLKNQKRKKQNTMNALRRLIFRPRTRHTRPASTSPLAPATSPTTTLLSTPPSPSTTTLRHQQQQQQDTDAGSHRRLLIRPTNSSLSTSSTASISTPEDLISTPTTPVVMAMTMTMTSSVSGAVLPGRSASKRRSRQDHMGARPQLHRQDAMPFTHQHHLQMPHPAAHTTTATGHNAHTLICD